MGLLKTAAGVVVTVVIGGTAYTVNHADVVNNFADDTGLTQQQAEEYVNKINEDDLIPYDQLGAGYVDDGKSILTTAEGLDCYNYQYDWESTTLSCDEGKKQLYEIGNDEIYLGNSYVKLSTDTSSRYDISNTIGLIDELNSDFEYEIVANVLGSESVTETKNTNSYNKALLKAALESN